MSSDTIPARQKAIDAIGLAGVTALEGAGLVVVRADMLSGLSELVDALTGRTEGATGIPAKLRDDPGLWKLVEAMCSFVHPTTGEIETAIAGCGFAVSTCSSFGARRSWLLSYGQYKVAIELVVATRDRDTIRARMRELTKSEVGLAIFVSIGELKLPDEIDGCEVVVVCYPGEP